MNKLSIRTTWRNAEKALSAGNFAEYLRLRRDLEGLTGRTAKELDLAIQ